jgi:transcriptional regulator with XRE-family HTH domain
MPTGKSPGFGELLKRQRLLAGLSQEELAGQAGLSPRGVSDLERGAHTYPLVQAVEALDHLEHQHVRGKTVLAIR